MQVFENAHPRPLPRVGGEEDKRKINLGDTPKPPLCRAEDRRYGKPEQNLLEGADAHGEAAWDEGVEEACVDGFLGGGGFHLVIAEDVGYEGFGFYHGEVLAYADTGAAAEGD